MRSPLPALALLAVLWGTSPAAPAQEAVPALVPWPALLEPAGDTPLELYGGGRVVAEDPSLLPLAQLLVDELECLTGLALVPLEGEGTGGDLVLRLEPLLPAGEVHLAVRAAAMVRGRTPLEVSQGTAVLLQLLELDGQRALLPAVRVEDRPASPWRGVMIDCARHTQPLVVLLQVVDLCRYFRLNRLHLHLTDDQAFTFPSRAFPQVVTAERHYTREELARLSAYAHLRGVELVPELDLPGHASALVRGDPERFGLVPEAKNGGLVNVGREETLASLERLLEELGQVFPHASTIHLGGDEVWLGGVLEDPHIRAAMEAVGTDDPAELVHRSLGRLAAKVKALGRTPAVWEGFGPAGAAHLPKDVVVLAWDGAYHHPRELAAAGFPMVNASWKPLYIVGGGRLAPHAAPRAWSPAELRRWHVRRFDQWEPDRPTFGGFELPEDTPVLGGQLCVWEQAHWSVLPDLLPRAPILAERTGRGRPEAGDPIEASLPDRARRAAERLRDLLYPVRLVGAEPGTAGQHWLAGPLTLERASPTRGKVHLARGGLDPGLRSPVWSGPLELEGPDEVAVGLFDAQGQQLGFSHRLRLAPRPQARVLATLYEAPEEGWSSLPDFRALTPVEQLRLPGLRGALTAGPAGLVLHATFVAPAAGEFTFDLRTFDGPARLSINGQTVVERGLVKDWEGTRGKVSLEPGPHTLTVAFAQGPVATLCRAFVQGPGIEQPVLVDQYLQPLED